MTTRQLPGFENSSNPLAQSSNQLPKKNDRVIITNDSPAAATAKVPSDTDLKAPRSLVHMYYEISNHAKWTEFITKHELLYLNLRSRVKVNEKTGTLDFVSGRKHNKILRDVWYYLIHGDTDALERAELAVVPKTRKKKDQQADNTANNNESDSE